MKKALLIALLILFTSSCAWPYGNPSDTPVIASTPTTLYLVTAAGDATPTPTPFQPLTEDGEIAWMAVTPPPPTPTPL